MKTQSNRNLEYSFDQPPQEASDPPSGEHSSPAPQPMQRARVLVVDDDRDMCELVHAELTRRGHSVSFLTSPLQALAALDSEDFSVVLVDIHMEEMNGLELCRAALAKRPELVVMVMTGLGDLEHAVGAIRAGAFDFLTKPFALDSLAQTVERASRQRNAADELQRLRQREYAPAVTADSKSEADELLSLAIVEERHIRKVLAAVGGNKTEAARILDFDRCTLHRKLTRYASA